MWPQVSQVHPLALTPPPLPSHPCPGILSIETYTSCDTPLVPERQAELSELLRVCDVFSPNEDEARSILGVEKQEGAGERAHGRGAKVGWQRDDWMENQMQ